jgi:hypothetical protein
MIKFCASSIQRPAINAWKRARSKPRDVGMVGQQLVLGGWLRRRSPVETVFKDRLDRAVGAGADVEAAAAGRLQARGAVMVRQAQNANARPVALFGMRPALQNQRCQFGGARPDRRRVGADALDRPVGIMPVRALHMLADCRVAATAADAEVDSDAFALAEQLDRALGDARIELLADQPIRHRVVMPVDVDMVIAPDPAWPPFGIFVRLGRQSL